MDNETREYLDKVGFDILVNAGAIRDNDHFVYASGQHGDKFANKRDINQRPKLMHQLCLFMTQLLVEHKDFDVIVGPADGAITLAHTLAYQLGVAQDREIFTAPAQKIKTLTQHQPTDIYKDKVEDNFDFNPADLRLISGQRILLAEDILTTGGSLTKVIQLIRKYNGIVVGATAIWNRGEVTAKQLGIPSLDALINLALPSWPAKDCPLCLEGRPINTVLGKGDEFLRKQQAASPSHVQ